MSNTDIGTKLAIATGRPATIDQAGYEALTWVEMTEGLVSIGAVGDTNETVTVPDMTTGRNKTLKGAKTGDTVNIAVSRQRVTASGALDPAQAAMKAAADSLCGEYSFRFVEPDCGAQNGVTQYICGPVANWKRTERTTTSYAGFTLDVMMNYAPVEVYPAPD